MGDQRNGTMPLVVDYKADIASPIQFDAVIVQVMSDPDHDGRFEDLNGNGRRDIQDLYCSSETLNGFQRVVSHPGLIITIMDE